MSTNSNSFSKNNDSMLRQIVEGALLAAGKPLSVQQLRELFEEDAQPAKDMVEAALGDIQADCKERGYELKEVANGWRFQVRQELSPWVLRLWEEKPQKYSRALLETLALVAYRQPITRGEIEDIRGVAVSTQIIKTLQERNWVRVIGHRDVPGRPAMYATTRDFLDYFNLKNLEDLPALADIRDLSSIGNELDLVQDNAVATAFADHNADKVADEVVADTAGENIDAAANEATEEFTDTAAVDKLESGADESDAEDAAPDDNVIGAAAQAIGDDDSDAETFIAVSDGDAAEVTDNAESADPENGRVFH